MADDGYEAGSGSEWDLHDGPSEELVEQARQNKARWDAFVRGSKERAVALPREDIRAEAFGVASLMFKNLLTGRLKPDNAKQAAEIAKIAYEVGRRETGDEDLATQVQTPEQRARAEEGLRALLATVQARALGAGDMPIPVLDVEEIVDADVLEDVAAGEAAGVVARDESAPPVAVLARVPRAST